jgi:hypothetical protein
LHSWNLTFALSIGVMICGVALSFFMKPEIPFVNGAARSRGEPLRTQEDGLSDAADVALELRQR